MNYNLTPGINLNDRTIYFNIPSGTTISEFKKIVETDDPDNYIAEDIDGGVSRGYYHYVNSENQEVFGIFYTSDGTNLSSIKLPVDFGTIIEIDDSAELYEYISRISHEKVYVVSEDFAKKESLGKEDIIAIIDEYVRSYGVPTNSIFRFDGIEADIPGGFIVTDDFNLYSDDEVIIGTYIDTSTNPVTKKPVYRKRVYCNPLPNTNQSSYSTGISNADLIINCYGTTSNGFLLNCVRPTGGNREIGAWFDTGDQKVHIETGMDRSSLSAKVYVEYTKSTD